MFQFLWNRPDRRPRLHESRAHAGSVRAVRWRPLWLHLAGAQVLQSVQSADRPAVPHSDPQHGALRGHAPQHAVMDILIANLTLPFSSGTWSSGITLCTDTHTYALLLASAQVYLSHMPVQLYYIRPFLSAF